MRTCFLEWAAVLSSVGNLQVACEIWLLPDALNDGCLAKGIGE
jgi:hypothetical protein